MRLWPCWSFSCASLVIWTLCQWDSKAFQNWILELCTLSVECWELPLSFYPCSLYTNFMPIKQAESLLNWRELKTDALNYKITQLIHFTDSFLVFFNLEVGRQHLVSAEIFTLFGNSRCTSYFYISNNCCL